MAHSEEFPSRTTASGMGRRTMLILAMAALGAALTGCALGEGSRKEVRMEISDDDIQKLVRLMDEERQTWIDGRFDPDARGAMEQAPDMTLFGPFGGPARTGGIAGAEGQRRANAAFQGGTGRCELVRAYTEGDLVVLLLNEFNEVKFTDRDEPHTWNLRTTQVLRREGGRWIRLHRHADPLDQRRTLEQTLALIDAPGAPR